MVQFLPLPFLRERQPEVVAKPTNLYPLPLRLLEPGQALPCTIFFKGPHGGEPSFQPQGRLFASVLGCHDSSAWGYFDLAEAGPLLSYLSSRLEEGTMPNGPTPADQAHWLYDTTLVWTQLNYIGEAPSRTAQQFHLAEKLVTRLLAALDAGEHPPAIIQAVRRHDSGVFTHVVNVCILGMAFARHLGWPEAKVVAFGLGALLHDIGMASLPRQLWAKTEPLTAREQEGIKTHPLRGVQLLETFGDLPEEIFFMTVQHHEGGDGAGYPLGLPEQAIHPWARLLRLLDTYEAMTSVRPWRAPLSSAKALKVLQHGAGDSSSTPVLLASFAEFCGEGEEGNG
jgi:hypothetical protein